jgi:hypothetical protein
MSQADGHYNADKFFNSNAAYHKHKMHFDSCLELFRFSEDSKEELSRHKIFTAEQRACALIFVRSQSLLISMLKLCNEGNLEDSGILLRSLFELYVDMKYIIKTKSGRRFLNFDIIYRYIVFTESMRRDPNNPKMKTFEFCDYMKNLTGEFNKIKDEYISKKGKLSFYWSKHDLSRKSNLVGEDISYEYLIRKYSAVAHCNAFGMRRLFKEDENGFEFYSGPTLEGLDEILFHCENLYGRILTELFGVLEAPVPENLKKYIKTSDNDPESA